MTPEEAVKVLRQAATAAEILSDAVEADGLDGVQVLIADEAMRANLAALHGLSAALEWAAEDTDDPPTVEAPVLRPVCNPIPFEQRRKR